MAAQLAVKFDLPWIEDPSKVGIALLAMFISGLVVGMEMEKP